MFSRSRDAPRKTALLMLWAPVALILVLKAMALPTLLAPLKALAQLTLILVQKTMPLPTL